MSVSVNQNEGYILTVCKGFLSLSEFREIADGGLEKCKATGIKKLLVDTHELKVLSEEITQYISNVWFPKAIDLGISRMAFIAPKSAIAMMSTSKANQGVEAIEIDYFPTEGEAKAWLKG